MTNETEISLEEIKTILSNYKGLKKQIRNHISDLYDDLMDTDNLIETVSIKKTEISEMGTKGGSKKDLSDIIIRHECILKRWYREISYEIESRMKKFAEYGCVISLFPKNVMRLSQKSMWNITRLKK